MKIAWLRRIFVLSMACLCVFAVTACSNSKKEDEAYKNAKALPPLEVPPDLVNPPKDASTAIPALPPADAQAKQTPSAAETGAAAGAGVHIEKQGASRWLVVPAPVDQVRQRVKDFLVQKGYAIAKEDPATGLVETDWHGEGQRVPGDRDLDAALKNALQDKFKFLIEAGRDAGTSEVRVSHLGLQRLMVDGKPEWQPRTSDPVLEAQILDELSAFLQNQGTETVPANDMPAVKTRVSTDQQGLSTLTIGEDFDRAWRRVGIALARSGFVIEDRNRSEGIYMIRLGRAFKEDAKGGFVSRLFGSNAGDPDEKYRIAVKEKGDSVYVTVQHPGGGPVFTNIGERILGRLKKEME